MKTLYININGEDIQSNADLHVVGRSEDALINAFYYELGNEILNGVPGVSRISKRDLVLEFKNHDKDRFDKILDQWTALKKIVLGPNPSGQFCIELPDEYVKWLQDKSDRVYRAIAMSLVNRGRKVNISVDNIYEAIELLIDSIEPDDCSDCEQFVVNDGNVTEASTIVIDIKNIAGNNLSFKLFNVWKDEYQNNDKSDNADAHDIDVFIEAVGISESGHYFSEFYSHSGKLIPGQYEQLGGSPYYLSDGNYFCLINNSLKKITEIDPSSVVYDKDNEWFDRLRFSHLIITNEDGFFVFNDKGRVAIKAGLYEEIRYTFYKDWVLAKRNGKWGVLSLNDGVVIPFNFSEISALGLNQQDVFCFAVSEEIDGETGVIDENGYQMIDFKYGEIELVGRWFNLFKVSNYDFDAEGVLDEYGNEVIPLEYDEIETLFSGETVFFKIGIGFLYGVFNINGELIIPIEYEDIELMCDCKDEQRLNPISFFKVKKGNDTGVISSNGEEVISIDCYETIDFDLESYNHIIARYYDDFDYFEDKWLRYPVIYEVSDKNGVFDENGLRICCEYPFGFYSQKPNGQHHYLKNKYGNIVYSTVCYELHNDFGKGKFYLERNFSTEDRYRNSPRKTIIIDSRGKRIGEVPNGYSEVDSFVNGMALAWNERTESCSVLNSNGQVIKDFDKTLHPFLSDRGEWYYIDDSGNIGYLDKSLSPHFLFNNKTIEGFTIRSIIQEGFFWIWNSDGLEGIFDLNTGIVIFLSNEEISFINNIFIKNKYFNGKPVANHNYFHIQHKNKKSTLIDIYGNVIFSKEYVSIVSIDVI